MKNGGAEGGRWFERESWEEAGEELDTWNKWKGTINEAQSGACKEKRKTATRRE